MWTQPNLVSDVAQARHHAAVRFRLVLAHPRRKLHDAAAGVQRRCTAAAAARPPLPMPMPMPLAPSAGCKPAARRPAHLMHACVLWSRSGLRNTLVRKGLSSQQAFGWQGGSWQLQLDPRRASEDRERLALLVELRTVLTQRESRGASPCGTRHVSSSNTTLCSASAPAVHLCDGDLSVGRSVVQAQTDKNFPSCLPSVPGQANGSLYSNLFCPVDPSKEPQGTLPDMQTAEAVLEMLRSRDWQSALPLFLAVGFHKPHIPFKFPAEYLQLIPPEEEIGLAPDPGVSVSRAFPSYTRSILTEMYLCHACSCEEIEDGNARAGWRRCVRR
eukprot:COSAG02_NODE_10479_length_1901_cov_0.931298_1_plen_329_part_00